MLWVALAAGVVRAIIALFPAWRFNGVWFVQNLCVGHLFPLVGIAVASTWFHLILSRRWTRPADWIDRVGRVVGIFWIVIGLAWTLRSYEPLIR